MPRTTGHPYTCPRCGYNTPHKATMKRHLYVMKTLCPPEVSNMILTNDIKDHVLAFRRYKTLVEQDTTPLAHVVNAKANQTIVNVTNNYNNCTSITNIQALLANTDVLKKITTYLDYTNKKVVELEKTIEKHVDNDPYTRLLLAQDRSVQIRKDEVVDLFRKVCAMDKNTVEELNVFCDSNKGIHYFDDGVWQTQMAGPGIQYIIMKVKDYYLDRYERYLIRNTEWANNDDESSKWKARLRDYFVLLNSFDIEPYCAAHCDEDILYDDRDDPSINYKELEHSARLGIKYADYYDVVGRDVTRHMRHNAHKMFFDVLHQITKKNLQELDKQVADLFITDPQFKLVLEHAEHDSKKHALPIDN